MKHLHWIMASSTLLALGASGCSASHASPVNRPLRVATFNAGLAPSFEPWVAERTQPTLDALAVEAKNLDVLCVQEFWEEPTFASLASAAAAQLPHATHPPAKPGTSAGACSPEKSEPLRSCGNTNCAGLTGDDLQTCVMAHCDDLIPTGDAGCFACLLAELGKGGDIDAIANACMGTSDGSSDADPAIYGGSYDVALLTRLPVVEESWCELSAYMVRVAALYNRLRLPDGKEVSVFCTHLTSPIGDLPYGGKNGDWSQEQALEVEELLKCVADKAGDTPVVLLGDLNTGPAEGDLTGELPKLYDELVASGLTDRAAGQEPPLCTLCPENTIRAGGTRERVDHIFTRGIELGPVTAFMTGKVEVSPGVTSNLSDHYGLVSR
jgi:endonuclease/exonuclease/phosphatase family metal-dependent hydrolase